MTLASILEGIREKNKKIKEQRTREIYLRIPEIKKIDEKIKKLSIDLIRGKDVSHKLDDLSKKRREALRGNGVSEDYLDLQYDCNKCKDQGYITYERDGRVHQEECSCRKKIRQNLAYDMSSIREMLKRQNFDNFDPTLFSTSRDKNREDISPRENILKIKENMEKYSKDFPAVKEGILFYGPTGTGKTFMCSCIAKEVIDRGYSVLYQNASELLEFMVTYSFMFYEGKLENEDKYNFIFDSDLLIIDDLGSEYLNDKTVSELFKLINTRLNSNKPIVISSNIDLEEISDIYGERIFSRILGQYDIYEFMGNDVRLNYLFN